MSIYSELRPRVKTANSTRKMRTEIPRVPEELWQAGLHQPLNHILQSEGKRLRAELVELSYHLAGGRGALPGQLIEFVELLHAGSLVIDDIEDGSEVRRGRPTLHKMVGTPLAINTGNWMYFSAMEKLTELPLEPLPLGKIMQETVTTIRRCHEGQALDLAACVIDLDVTAIYPTAQAISNLKTGGLTALAAKLGAAVAGGSPELQACFHSFGMQLGIGLQMQNDLAELNSAATALGRSDDFRNARVTWPWAWASQLRSETEVKHLQELLAQSTSENFQEVALALTTSISNQRDTSIRTMINGAVSCLKETLPSNSLNGLNEFMSRIEGYYV